MGNRMAPSYDNLFIGKFEQQAIDNSLLKPFIWWRFIDDIFTIWTHGEEHLKSSIGSHLRTSVPVSPRFNQAGHSIEDVRLIPIKLYVANVTQ